MILMGRPSLSVIIVMLLPAAAMERRRLSSSSVQKRGLLFGMVMSLRPARKERRPVLGVDAQGQFEGASWNALAFNEDGFRPLGLQDDFGNVMIWGIFARRRGSKLTKQAGLDRCSTISLKPKLPHRAAHGTPK